MGPSLNGLTEARQQQTHVLARTRTRHMLTGTRSTLSAKCSRDVESIAIQDKSRIKIVVERRMYNGVISGGGRGLYNHIQYHANDFNVQYVHDFMQ